MSNSFISVFGSPGGVGLDPTFNVVTLNLVQGTSNGANSMSIGGNGGLNIIGPIISAGNFSGLSLIGAQATNTINISTTWDTTGNPTLIYGRATNTNSGASANLLDLGTTAAGSLIKITKAGAISGPVNSLTLGTDPRLSQQNTNRPIELSTVQGYVNIFDSIPRLGFSTTGGNTAPNECISRTAAFTYQFGLNTASTPNAQTIKAHNVTTGTGADLILSGGTGSVASGNVRFGTYTNTISAITGYITIKDEGGTTRRLAVVA
jgi:hypothetical protein